MRDNPLPPSDAEGVNPQGIGPAQPRPAPEDNQARNPPEGETSNPPPDDRTEITDNLKRERSKGSRDSARADTCSLGSRENY
jgi:hypothetical protein